MVKLGIAGTHSTGKTTFVNQLASWLEKRGLRVGRVEDLAPRANDLGFPILRGHTFDSTLWIMSRGISEQLEAGRSADVVLVDRPAIDAVGYLWAALEHRGETLSQTDADYLLALARHDAATYHVLYRTVLDPQIPLGVGRDSDPEFREAADRHIKAVFARLGVEARVVPSIAFVEEVADELARACGR